MLETTELPAGIAELLEDYFEVMYSQDMVLFDKVFHNQCCLYSSQGDTELSIRPYAVYRQAVLDRKSPAELGEQKASKVLGFDAISPTLALVRVQVSMFGNVMQDYLNLVRIDGKWWIIAKLWEKVS